MTKRKFKSDKPIKASDLGKVIRDILERLEELESRHDNEDYDAEWGKYDR